MRKRSWIAFGMFLLLSVGACAQNTELSGFHTELSGFRRDPNVIRADEMTELLDRSVYEVVQQLRPRWLFNFNGLPSLIIDNQPHPFDFLETMRPVEVESLSLLNAADATFRWGTGYPNGVIQIEPRRRRLIPFGAASASVLETIMKAVLPVVALLLGGACIRDGPTETDNHNPMARSDASGARTGTTEWPCAYQPELDLQEGRKA